ncbi:MAG: citrate transporter, partial [Oscillospiraceae bacterium]|nr:citrate transporter [Oscillospiraceae bacterium]
GLAMGDFINALLPIGIASYILLSICCLLVRNEKMEVHRTETKELPVKKLIVFGVLFAVCLLTVLRVIPHWLCLCIVCAGLLIEWRLFTKIDYALLLTFVCFFVFVGNMGRIEAVSTALSSLMEGRELIVSALVSQVISNVPAAVMLSAFTDNAVQLLQGVNIGGLGTPVASLASLISYQIYARSENAEKGKYMALFLAINTAGLAVLLIFAFCIYR